MGWIRTGLIAGAVLAGTAWIAAVALDPGPPDLPDSDHFDGERFFMPGHANVGDKSFADLLRWQAMREPVPWPEVVPIRPKCARRFLVDFVNRAFSSFTGNGSLTGILRPVARSKIRSKI